jgi:hypothetical protein
MNGLSIGSIRFMCDGITRLALWCGATPEERWRLEAGRHDWRERSWQDDCGRPGGCCLQIGGPRCYD